MHRVIGKTDKDVEETKTKTAEAGKTLMAMGIAEVKATANVEVKATANVEGMATAVVEGMENKKAIAEGKAKEKAEAMVKETVTEMVIVEGMAVIIVGMLEVMEEIIIMVLLFNEITKVNSVPPLVLRDSWLPNLQIVIKMGIPQGRLKFQLGLFLFRTSASTAAFGRMVILRFMIVTTS